MEKRLTDITTLTAVESLFHNGVKDPWAAKLAGDLADWYAYSPVPTFILPESSALPADLKVAALPKIVEALRQRESTVMQPRVCTTGSQGTLLEEFQHEAVVNFLAWCKSNPKRLQTWIAVHRQTWVTGGHAIRIPHRYLYDVTRAFSESEFRGSAKLLNIPLDDLGYALDVALRYPLYGQFAGEKSIYLSHPLREQRRWPTMEVSLGENPPVALSFAPSVASIASSLTLDQYASLLHEIRAVVSDRGLANIRPGAIEHAQASVSTISMINGRSIERRKIFVPPILHARRLCWLYDILVLQPANAELG